MAGYVWQDMVVVIIGMPLHVGSCHACQIGSLVGAHLQIDETGLHGSVIKVGSYFSKYLMLVSILISISLLLALPTSGEEIP